MCKTKEVCKDDPYLFLPGVGFTCLPNLPDFRYFWIFDSFYLFLSDFILQPFWVCLLPSQYRCACFLWPRSALVGLCWAEPPAARVPAMHV